MFVDAGAEGKIAVALLIGEHSKFPQPLSDAFRPVLLLGRFVNFSEHFHRGRRKRVYIAGGFSYKPCASCGAIGVFVLAIVWKEAKFRSCSIV